MQNLQAVPELANAHLDAMARLRVMAEEAIDEYNQETAMGGEPLYPRWAGDMLDVLLLVLNQRGVA